MFYHLHTGCLRRDLPEHYGPWKTVYDRFSRYRRDGTFDRIIERLQLRLDQQGKIEWDLFCVDGSNVRATRAVAGTGQKTSPRRPADNALGCSRGGFGTKFHLVVDGHGTPLAVMVSAGQAHESNYI